MPLSWASGDSVTCQVSRWQNAGLTALRIEGSVFPQHAPLGQVFRQGRCATKVAQVGYMGRKIGLKVWVLCQIAVDLGLVKPCLRVGLRRFCHRMQPVPIWVVGRDHGAIVRHPRAIAAPKRRNQRKTSSAGPCGQSVAQLWNDEFGLPV